MTRTKFLGWSGAVALMVAGLGATLGGCEVRDATGAPGPLVVSDAGPIALGSMQPMSEPTPSGAVAAAVAALDGPEHEDPRHATGTPASPTVLPGGAQVTCGFGFAHADDDDRDDASDESEAVHEDGDDADRDDHTDESGDAHEDGEDHEAADRDDDTDESGRAAEDDDAHDEARETASSGGLPTLVSVVIGADHGEMRIGLTSTGITSTWDIVIDGALHAHFAASRSTPGEAVERIDIVGVGELEIHATAAGATRATLDGRALDLSVSPPQRFADGSPLILAHEPHLPADMNDRFGAILVALAQGLSACSAPPGDPESCPAASGGGFTGGPPGPLAGRDCALCIQRADGILEAALEVSTGLCAGVCASLPLDGFVGICIIACAGIAALVEFINHEIQVADCINSPTCCETPCLGRPSAFAICCPIGQACGADFLCGGGPACGPGFCPLGNACISDPTFDGGCAVGTGTAACCPATSQLCAGVCCIVPPPEVTNECSSGTAPHCCHGPADAGVGLINGANGEPCINVTTSGGDPSKTDCCPPNLACTGHGNCCAPSTICPATGACCAVGDFCTEVGSGTSTIDQCCPFGTQPCSCLLGGIVPATQCAPGDVGGTLLCPSSGTGVPSCAFPPPQPAVVPTGSPWG